MLPLHRHGSTCFGESSNLPTMTDDHSIGAQEVEKFGRVATREIDETKILSILLGPGAMRKT